MECLAVGEVQLIARRLVCADHNPLLGGDLIGRSCLSVVQLDGWSDVNFLIFQKERFQNFGAGDAFLRVQNLFSFFLDKN